jgi:hypothetical protein
LKLRRAALWRSAAATLWILSVICLIKALGDGVSAEKWLYNPHLTDVDRASIQHLQAVADYWASAGWSLQFATAAVLSQGIQSERVVRRIFASLGVLIATDGVVLLLIAVIVH